MAVRFNSPPGWPTPPAGWVPPTTWRPDPSWPPAPPGWQFWVEEHAPLPAIRPIPMQPERATSYMPGAVAPVAAPGAAAQSSGHSSGLFGGRRRQLEAENDELRTGNLRLSDETVGLRAAVDQLKAE